MSTTAVVADRDVVVVDVDVDAVDGFILESF